MYSSITQNHIRKLRHIVKNFNLGKPEKVKVRQNGITSEGIPEQCHNNVAHIQSQYGGRCVKGFGIHRDNITKVTTLFSHSVWETPEGKLVDVTLKWTGENEILFYPLRRYDCTKEHYVLSFDFHIQDDIHQGVIRVNTSNQLPNETFPMNIFKRRRKLLDRHLFYRKENYLNDSWYTDYLLKYKK